MTEDEQKEIDRLIKKKLSGSGREAKLHELVEAMMKEFRKEMRNVVGIAQDSHEANEYIDNWGVDTEYVLKRVFSHLCEGDPKGGDSEEEISRFNLMDFIDEI